MNVGGRNSRHKAYSSIGTPDVFSGCSLRIKLDTPFPFHIFHCSIVTVVGCNIRLLGCHKIGSFLALSVRLGIGF